MSDVLIRIKRAVIAGRYAFMIYTKGKLMREADEDHFYFLISSKRAL